MVEALGLSLVQFLFYLINFLLLIGILGKFLYKPFLAMLDNRTQSIKDAFDSAEATNKKADEKLENYNRKIAKAEAEGNEIIRESKTQAEGQAKKIIDEANAKATQMVQAAERQIELERSKALADMKGEVTTLAMMAAEKIMEKDLEKTGEQEQIVDRIIEEAGTSGWQN
ncbi:MAG: F0F1 ATP synthase subunit B [Firmicutes bacterium]|nr:F0F1 ATP synthase subunit B [Bacillota bacterium]